MNFVLCSENCRWQQDGMCTLEDITRISAVGKGCCHYEEASKNIT
ncbi:MAG: hypothetical protein ACI4KA_10345 [Oscillospiraceae bacterium]